MSEKSRKTEDGNRQTIKVKPLSVNKLWQGRRFKTSAYKAYEQELFYLLKPIKVAELGERVALKITFGFSSRRSDLDNALKGFLDICTKKYGIDDSRIYRLEVKKDIVPRGEEYISFVFAPF